MLHQKLVLYVAKILLNWSSKPLAALVLSEKLAIQNHNGTLVKQLFYITIIAPIDNSCLHQLQQKHLPKVHLFSASLALIALTQQFLAKA